jgi:hypothetical protein
VTEKEVVASRLREIATGDRVTSNEAQWLEKAARLLTIEIVPNVKVPTDEIWFIRDGERVATLKGVTFE